MEQDEMKEQEIDWKTKYMYLQAEFENYRKRTTKEKSEWKDVIVTDVIKEILPIADDLERSIKHNPKSEGRKLIYSKLQSVFNNFGITMVENTEFDADFHEAVSLIPNGNGKEIVSVVQNGYTIGNKLIRPSKVVVR